MFHGDIKGRSYGNERVEISWESDYCLEFGWIRVVTLQATLKNIMQCFYVPSRFHPTEFSSRLVNLTN